MRSSGCGHCRATQSKQQEILVWTFCPKSIPSKYASSLTSFRAFTHFRALYQLCFSHSTCPTSKLSGSSNPMVHTIRMAFTLFHNTKRNGFYFGYHKVGESNEPNEQRSALPDWFACTSLFMLGNSGCSTDELHLSGVRTFWWIDFLGWHVRRTHIT